MGRTLAVAALLCCAAAAAQAEADGPDFYRVVDVRPGHRLTIRAAPSTTAAALGAIPAGADHLRNLGCEGGLSFAEWQKATPEARAASRDRRWCRVEHDGRAGWVAGRHLAEGSAP